jgi:nucleotide-binding universal stress UspA family protein
MFQRIIVPLDGSSRAERAIPVAASLARATQGSIVFLRVVAPEQHTVGWYGAEPGVGVVADRLETALAEADRYLESLVATFRDYLAGIKVEAEVETGAPAALITSAARWEHADLVVLCSHGDTGFKRWVFQSIALQATRTCPVPILILNEHDEVRPLENLTHSLQVLVPLDGSTLSETALAPAVQLMRTLTPAGNGTLHLLRVVDVPVLNGSMRGQTVIDPLIREHACAEAQKYLDTVVKGLQEATEGETPLSITTSVIVSPDVPGTIIEQAKAKGCDLITLATHGRGALMRVLMGSVTGRVVGYTSLPLLVVRPPKPVAKQKEAYELMDDEKQLPSWVGLL